VDIPQCLEYLTRAGRLRPGEDWGPDAGSSSLYPDFADRWRGDSPVPTLAEMDAAWQQVLAARRKARRLADVLADVQALGAADRNKLLAAVCAAFLIDRPKFARALNIPIDGDQPA